MTEPEVKDERWERELVSKLAMAALAEQRRSRRWGIFFKLLTFAYVTVILLLAVDWGSRSEMGGDQPPIFSGAWLRSQSHGR